MSSVVFDASAILAVLNRERGHEKASPLLRGATVSAVNYGEVLKKSVEIGGSIATVQFLLNKQSLRIVPFDVQHAVQAATIWPQSKPLGLSYADRACVALGILLNAPVVTAEANMAKIDLPVEFHLIRKPQ